MVEPSSPYHPDFQPSPLRRRLGILKKHCCAGLVTWFCDNQIVGLHDKSRSPKGMTTMRPIRTIATALLVASLAMAGCQRPTDQTTTAVPTVPDASASVSQR